jgi:transcriptional regulator with XRE-family HTH domain
MPPSPLFAERFRELITSEPNQFEVARKIGCSQSYVAQISRGQARPGRELVERIIEAYELPRDEWIELAGYGKPRRPGSDPLDMVRLAVQETLRQSEASGHDVFWREFGHWVQECADAGLPLPETPRFSGGTRDFTPDQARRHLAVLRRAHEEELLRGRQLHSGTP